MTEIWKDIEGYESLYQVSNLGRVKSTKRNHWTRSGVITIEKEIIMKLSDNGNGYKIVNLFYENKRTRKYVHRLVAEAFIEKEEGKNYVNHIDFDRSNNIVSNLEWCTQCENVQYSKLNMKKQHNSKTSTGERYITYRPERSKYRVCIKRADVDKLFETMSEAICFRNEVLNEIGYTI